ncbi:MAG TPA: TetR/AcrR family transcriptional regulator [Thermoanaerobaculia bacterium]|nr:TetR/AcrR family transcriptional regulator [Thermoanaerobaculia bacterium]
MQREEKSERSRRAVLDAALHLFSHHGYRATTVREIAVRADVSTGNLYHHFPDKEAIFRALLDEYIEITNSPRFPFTRVLYGNTTFPDNIEELGFAARDSIRQYKSYLALVYVDVIEFGGTHIQKFYAGMSERFERFLAEKGLAATIQARLRPSVSPVSALLYTSRLFFNYFSLEILFGVNEPFGKDSNEVVKEIADMVRNGVCESRS